MVVRQRRHHPGGRGHRPRVRRGQRRDPKRRRAWVALVDGANHQIERIKLEARKREVKVTIVVDFVHVLHYLWNAAACLHPDSDQSAARWVHRQAIRVLEGHARKVAGGIRRQATNARLPGARRQPADEAANYLTNKTPYLDYPTALRNGWPIATGIVEGACRHLIKDRMDITGARWGLAGAEAILSYAPSKPTATSRSTGATTSPKNTTTSTKPATSITPSRASGVSEDLCRYERKRRSCLQPKKRSSSSQRLILICMAPAASRQASRRRPPWGLGNLGL